MRRARPKASADTGRGKRRGTYRDERGATFSDDTACASSRFAALQGRVHFRVLGRQLAVRPPADENLANTYHNPPRCCNFETMIDSEYQSSKLRPRKMSFGSFLYRAACLIVLGLIAWYLHGIKAEVQELNKGVKVDNRVDIRTPIDLPIRASRPIPVKVVE